MTRSGDASSVRTVVDAVVDRAGGTGTLTVLRAGAPDVLPWRTLHERARRTATVLAGYGLRPGRRAGLVADTCLDLVTALQAVWLTGASVTLLPPSGRDGRRAHHDYLGAVVADARLTLLLVDDDATGAALSGATTVVPLASVTGAARPAPPAEPYRPAPADLAVLQYTSGSTRTPRGVPVTHAHLAANIDAIRIALDHDASHPGCTVSWLPLFHDMGLIAFLLLPMSCGCPLVLQPPTAFARRPVTWLDTMSRHRATMSGAPNFAFALMTRLLAAGLELDLHSMRCLISGGEPVDPAVMAGFAAAAGRYRLDPAALTPAYGLAEATLAATVSPLGSGVRTDRIDPVALENVARAVPVSGPRFRDLVRVGRPVPGTSVRVVDRHTGEPVGERSVGHVELAGPSVVGHYWGEPPPPAGVWLRTGDLGYLVAGELVVCGREKDVLFAAGRNVFPQDVEAIAAEVPGVRSGCVAAFGIPHPRGDRLVVAVEARGADPATLRRDVTAAVAGEAGLTPVDVAVLPPGRLPRTSSGKLRRAETRRRYLAGDLHG